ncbi:MAG: response regulator [Candidatus Omnitrophica bacterium]|nr:response regulator [Candidatus Omnitrophota bacterium]
MKILIVDDSRLDRTLVRNVIKKAGFTNEIMEASDGEEGFSLLSDHFNDICLILLDWEMPKMNGIQFLQAVGRVPAVSHIPVIMISASGSEKKKQEAHDANPLLAGYIVKPYSSETLINKIGFFVK